MTGKTNRKARPEDGWRAKYNDCGEAICEFCEQPLDEFDESLYHVDCLNSYLERDKKEATPRKAGSSRPSNLDPCYMAQVDPRDNWLWTIHDTIRQMQEDVPTQEETLPWMDETTTSYRRRRIDLRRLAEIMNVTSCEEDIKDERQEETEAIA